jgi:3-oxoacyl-[acyl-carrier-protein] synthase-3
MTTIPRQRPTLSTTSGTDHARIWGVGGYRPERVVTNDEICEHIDSSDQWIRERSGIITRRFAALEETVVDMASAAALEALKSSGLTPSQVDAIIVATVTHPYQTPGAAPMVADRIGATPAAAFDISAACAIGAIE